MKLKLTLKSTLEGGVKGSVCQDYGQTYFFPLTFMSLPGIHGRMCPDFEISTSDVAASSV